jgi:hypothetical protein
MVGGESRTFQNYFFLFFLFSLTIEGGKKDKKTKGERERRASLDWMGKIILTTNNRKYEERRGRERDLSAARTNRWCGMKDGRYV